MGLQCVPAGRRSDVGPVAEEVRRMRIDSSEAAAMYARACRAWYGKRASKVISQQIRNLKARGDADGVAVWSQVADQVLRLSKMHRHGDPELRGKLYQ
jgi:hypothetical protein